MGWFSPNRGIWALSGRWKAEGRMTSRDGQCEWWMGPSQRAGSRVVREAVQFADLLFFFFGRREWVAGNDR